MNTTLKNSSSKSAPPTTTKRRRTTPSVPRSDGFAARKKSFRGSKARNCVSQCVVCGALTCANLTQTRASSPALRIRISSSAQYYPKLGIDTGLSPPSGLKVRSTGTRARAWESWALAVSICIAVHILVKQMKVPPYLVVFGLGPDPAYPTPSCVVPAREKRKKNPPPPVFDLTTLRGGRDGRQKRFFIDRGTKTIA